MFFIHYVTFYINVFIFTAILLTLAKIYKIKDALKITFFFSFLIILAPILDIFIGGGHYNLDYLQTLPEVINAFINSFNPFVSLPGITPGMRIEGFIGILSFFLLFVIKKKNLFVSLLFTFIYYTGIILLGGGLAVILARIFHSNFESVFGFTPSLILEEDLRFVAFHLMVFFIFFLLVLYFYYSRKRFIQLFVNLRWKRLLTYLISAFTGFATGLKLLSFAYPAAFHNPIDWTVPLLLFLSFLFAYNFAVILNDYEDREADKISSQKNLFNLKLIRLSEKHYAIGLNAIFAILCSLSLNYYATIIMIIMLSISILYSTPPFKLKRFWPISVITLGFEMYLSFIYGLTITAHFAAFNIASREFTIIYLITIPLIFTVKDLKDYNGDLATGTKTLYTILGPHKGTIVTGFLLIGVVVLIEILLHLSYYIFLLMLITAIGASLYLIKAGKAIEETITNVMKVNLKTFKLLNENILFSALFIYLIVVNSSVLKKMKPPLYLKDVLPTNLSEYYPITTPQRQKTVIYSILNKGDSAHLFLLSEIALSTGDTIGSINYLLRLVNYWSSSLYKSLIIDNIIFIHINDYLVKLFSDTGQLEEALIINSELLHYGPYSAYSYLLLGNIYTFLAQYHKALYSFKAAAYLNPSPNTYLSLALTFKALGYSDSFTYYFNRYLLYKSR